MKNQLQVFENQEFGKVRVIDVDGRPWFVGKDVCDVFGDSHYRRSIMNLDEDEKGVTQIDTPGGKQNMSIINESGLYSLLFIMKPTKARGVSKEHITEREARLKSFRRWVTHDVLPSIRRHGAYIKDDLLNAMAENVELTQEVIRQIMAERGKNESLKAKNEALIDYVETLAPKARYYDIVLKYPNAVQVSIIAEDYGMTAVAFNKLLHALGVQYKIHKTWLLYRKYKDLGYTVSNTYFVGSAIASVHTLWTQRGRYFIYDLLRWYGILPVSERINAMIGGEGNICQ